MKINIDENSSITSILFSNDSKCIVYSTNKGKIYMSTVVKNSNTSGSVIHQSESFSKLSPETVLFSNYFCVLDIKFSPFSNNILAVALETGTVTILDIVNSQNKHDFTEAHSVSCTGVRFSPINKMLLVSIGLDGNINFYDIILKKIIKTFELNFPIHSLSFYQDGKTIACGGLKGQLSIYDLSLGKEPKLHVKGHYNNIQCIEFSKKIFNNEKQSLNNKIYEQIQNQNHLKVKNSINLSKINTRDGIVNQNLDFKENELEGSLRMINENEEDFIKDDFSDLKSKSNKLNESINTNTNIFSQNKFQDKLEKFEKIEKYEKFSNFDRNNKSERHDLEKERGERNDRIENKINYDDFIYRQENNRKTKEDKNSKLAILDKNEISNIIRETIKEEMNNVKKYIHEEIKHVHLDLIRQIHLQEINLVNEIRNCVAVNQDLNKEIKTLKKENNKLKSNFF